MNLEATRGWQEKVLIADELCQLLWIKDKARARFPTRWMTDTTILNLQDPCTFMYSYFTDEKVEVRGGSTALGYSASRKGT